VAVLQQIRLVAAVALLSAMFMPLSECARGKSNQPPPPAKPLLRQLVSRCSNLADCDYVVKEMKDLKNFGDLKNYWGSFLVLFTFVWPFYSLLAIRLSQGRRFTWLLHVLELMLCGGTLYLLWSITFFGEYRYGTTVVLAAVSSIVCVALIDIFLIIRGAIRRRKSRKQTPASPHSG
jgi:hypothetical protein